MTSTGSGSVTTPLAGQPPAHRGGLAGWQVRRLQAVVASELQTVTVARLAAETRLSDRQFQRAFRATMGSTAKRWLQGRRAEQAAALLLDGSSVAEAAGQVGYRSAAQLTRAFVSRFGETPSDFRRR